MQSPGPTLRALFKKVAKSYTYCVQQRLKRLEYRIEIVFLRVASPQLALRRIAARVRQGGHDVPKADVIRRFERGWANFRTIYQSLADAWVVYENSGKIAREINSGPRTHE